MEWNDQLMDEALRRSAATLDENYPAGLPPVPALWAAIDTKRKRNRVVRIQRWSAAATLLLLASTIACWLVAKKAANISFPLSNSQPATENEAMSYIKQVCMGDNIVCHSPVFKELQFELDATTTALDDINQQLKLFGDDEQLIRAKTRIENHQARIVKAMLQTL